MSAARILVVEDEDLVRKFVKDILVSKGYDIQTAETAEAGLEQFGQHSFDVVISDVNLPGIDGIEMVKQMRASDPTIVPVVMTARRDQKTAVRAMRLGIAIIALKVSAISQIKPNCAIAPSGIASTNSTRYSIIERVPNRNWQHFSP